MTIELTINTPEPSWSSCFALLFVECSFSIRVHNKICKNDSTWRKKLASQRRIETWSPTWQARILTAILKSGGRSPQCCGLDCCHLFVAGVRTQMDWLRLLWLPLYAYSRLTCDQLLVVKCKRKKERKIKATNCSRPDLNWRPCACKADVIATTLRKRRWKNQGCAKPNAMWIELATLGQWRLLIPDKIANGLYIP